MLQLKDTDFHTLVADKRNFIQSFFKIQNKDQLVVPFILNKAQNYLYDNLPPTGRVTILKARQMGFSTEVLALMLARAITVPNTVCVCISYEEDATKRLFRRLKFMYESLPPELQHRVDHNSSYELNFPDLHSNVYIGSAKSFVFGKGDTIHMMHCSEIASWPEDKARSILSDINQAVPLTTGQVFLESTPEGRSGIFYNIYQEGKKGGLFKPFFFPWWWQSEYQLPYGSEFAPVDCRYNFDYNDYEAQLVSANSLTQDQIRWRRAKVKEAIPASLGSGHSAEDEFLHQYPEDDEGCWLVSGTTIFDQIALRNMLLLCKPPLETREHKLYWRYPVGGHKYIMGIDSAKGLAHGDFSSAVLVDIQTMEQVASIHARLKRDKFAQECLDLGHQYNNALAVIELPGPGETILNIFKTNGYPRIYRPKPTSDYGFSNNVHTRQLLIDKTAIYIANRLVSLNDPDLVHEAMVFQEINDKAQAPAGEHDDYLFACMLALVVRDMPQYSGSRPYVPSESYL